MAVQRKLEILADANLVRGIPQKALSFIVLSDHRRISSMARAEGAVQAEGCATAIWVLTTSVIASKAKQSIAPRRKNRLLRFARNDEEERNEFHHPRQRNRFRRLAQSRPRIGVE